MIDFLDTFFQNRNSLSGGGYEKERSKQKAVSVILPLIMKYELTNMQSLCIRYKYINGKTQREIADILRLSQPTVSRHIRAGKRIINDNLKYCYVALSKCLDEYDRLNDL